MLKTQRETRILYRPACKSKKLLGFFAQRKFADEITNQSLI
jgi:hypothetical protein